MAVLLCPGDRTDRLGAWARGLGPIDLGRIVFYDHGADPEAFEGWLAAGLPAQVLRFPVADFKPLIVRFGQHLNQRILVDYRPLEER